MPAKGNRIRRPTVPSVGARDARDFFLGLCGLATAAVARAHGALLQVVTTTPPDTTEFLRL
jgi:hypothetical protein